MCDADHLSFNPEYLKLSFEQARLALSEGEVPIGAVFVQHTTKKVVAQARNQVNARKNASSHAEIVGIEQLNRHNKDQADDKIDFRDLVVYVNCEPCIMCADALKKIKVKGAAADILD